jgi:hypothetical protein
MSGKEYGPVPRIIGIGPIRMTAPALLVPKFGIEPKAISNVPTKMAAKATRNSKLAKENWNC